MDPKRQAAGELFLARYTDATNFTAMLIRLIFKADYSHRARLALGFPIEVHIVTEWETDSESAKAFFAKYKINTGEKVL
jgi:hypothetical protein